MAALPPGLESIFCTGATQEAHKFRTGEDLTEQKPYTFVSRQAILDECQFKGAISDFHPVKDKLKKYGGETVLIVWDVEEVYGNNILVAVTEAARDAQLAAYKAAEDAQLAAAAAKAAAAKAAEAGEVGEDGAELLIVSKPWVSRGSEKEVEAAAVAARRARMVLIVTRARSEFGLGFKLSDRDAHDGFVECRPFKDPNFELRRAERSCATQAIAPLVDGCSQTEWHRPLNKALQAEPQLLDPPAQAAALAAPALAPFLAAARARLESALQQNELVDIFGDDLAALAEDDASLSNKSDSDVRELQSFSRNSFSTNRVVSAAQWKPGATGVVAVSLARNLSFEERVEVAGRVHTGHVLVWTFADPIAPAFALESPQEVLSFQFNPSFPNLLLAGVASGQLVLWDLTDKPSLSAGGGDAFGAEADAGADAGAGAGGNQTVHLQPCGTSAVEFSHRRGVSAIAWLPARHTVTPAAKLKYDEVAGASWSAWQCATMACDGYVCFWDLRSARRATYADATRASDKERRRDPVDKEATEAVEAGLKKDEYLWVPICRIALSRPDGGGELSGCLFEICGVPAGARLYAGTEEGEFAAIDLSHIPLGGAAAPSNEDVGVKLVLPAHVAQCTALARSPFFKDIYLTVGDWSCCVWKAGVVSPLFSSPYAAERLTTGCWSPTRAGVLFLARADGSVDVWDLIDRTHEPSTSFNVVGGSAVTALSMFAQQSTQMLAAGDEQGTLHVMEIPRNLRRAHNSEKAAMAAFFEREVARVNYVAAQALLHHGTSAPDASNPEAAAAEAAAAARDDAGARDDDDGFDAKAEAEYRVLEAAFKLEFGLRGEGGHGAEPRGAVDATHAQLNGDSEGQ